MFYQFLETRWKVRPSDEEMDLIIGWVIAYCDEKDFEEFCRNERCQIKSDGESEKEEEKGKEEEKEKSKEKEKEETTKQMSAVLGDPTMQQKFAEYKRTVPKENRAPKLKIRGKLHRGDDRKRKREIKK